MFKGLTNHLFSMNNRFSILVQNASNARKLALKMVHKSGSSHIGSALSSIDLLVALYGGILKINPKKPKDPNRDIFILSKGHACTALYSTLVVSNFADKKILEGFSQDDGTLWGHSTYNTIPWVEVSTGSLGHGLPVGLGMALANTNRRVFVMVGDGECDEGSVWESILFAGHKKVQNLILIVDYNKIQSLGNTSDVLNLEPLSKKFEACNWAAKEIDGHDFRSIILALENVPLQANKPTAIIAHTVKGKGVAFMENSIDWHYKPPNDSQLASALEGLL